MLATRIAALLLTAILFIAPAREVELDFQLMDWPSRDAAVNARIAQRYQLDRSKLPTLQSAPPTDWC